MVYLFPIFAVLFGASVAYYFKPYTPKGIKMILAFSGAYLLGILILDMLPHIYDSNGGRSGIWILAGIVFQNFLEFFSKGAEHGHTTHSTHEKMPWLLLSLSIHAFLEGLPLPHQTKLLWAVSVHKIPIGLVVGLMLFQIKGRTFLKFGALTLFAVMTPLGSLLGGTLNSPFLMGIIDPFIVGILFHISTTILFESSEGHEFNLQKFLSILLGIGIAAFV
ncbi:MAG: ZIP family metal transporter [Flavobacteriaceae bacterium]